MDNKCNYGKQVIECLKTYPISSQHLFTKLLEHEIDKNLFKKNDGLKEAEQLYISIHSYNGGMFARKEELIKDRLDSFCSPLEHLEKNIVESLQKANLEIVRKDNNMQKVKVFIKTWSMVFSELEKEMNDFIEKQNVNVISITCNDSYIVMLYEPKPTMGV